MITPSEVEMKLVDKLVLSARPGKIALFREGAFVRLYNHSLMRWLMVERVKPA